MSHFLVSGNTGAPGNVSVFTNTGTFQYLGPQVYLSPSLFIHPYFHDNNPQQTSFCNFTIFFSYFVPLFQNLP